MPISKQMCKERAANSEAFEVAITEQVAVSENSREGYADLLYMPKLECNLLGRELQVPLGVGVIP